MRIPCGSGPNTKRGRPWHGVVSLFVAVFLSAFTLAALGCATPEERHRLLTIFFDDVPPLEADPAEASPKGLAEPDADAPARRRPVKQIVSVHGPVAAKECELCHESRFSREIEKLGADLCWSCHPREDFSGAVLHGPAAAGRCDSCHEPHRSEFPKLLVQPEAEICAYCHVPANFSDLEEHRSTRGENCQDCHDAHAGDVRYMLRREADAS
jgi:predicted CXXCH cytochrome family protein